LKNEGRCPVELTHRTIPFLNNGLEADHGQLKRLIKPTLGFKSVVYTEFCKLRVA
jgi:transposase-like protein